jgi:hypothetical protein
MFIISISNTISSSGKINDDAEPIILREGSSLGAVPSSWIHLLLPATVLKIYVPKTLS